MQHGQEMAGEEKEGLGQRGGIHRSSQGGILQAMGQAALFSADSEGNMVMILIVIIVE